MKTKEHAALHPELVEMRVNVEDETHAYKARHFMALTRLALGWYFLWAFVDKVFGLTFSTERADAWINGGSPTYGYLTFGTEGSPLHGFFSSITGPFADWMFMIGLLGVGAALLLGIGMRIAAGAGGLMMLLMWASSLPLDTNPFMNNHIIYGLAMGAMAAYGAGRYWGLGRKWENLPIVQRFPILK